LSSPENPQQNLIALLPETATTGEIFNIHETGEVARGQLRRFLKIPSAKLDEAKGLVDAFPTMIDVDITDSDYLPYIGELLGVKFNREIPIPQAREEIKQAVQWYKRKGTLIGCRIHGYKISRLQTDIVEFWRNIKTSVTLDSVPGNIRHSFSMLGAGHVPNYQLPGDKTAFSYDYADRDVLKVGMELASSEVPGYEAWRAIDDEEATSWRAVGPAPAYWGFEYPDPILPIKFRMKAGLGVERFRVQWADASTGPWTDAGEYVYGDVRRAAPLLGQADGLAQTFVFPRVPVAQLPIPKIFEVTGYGALTTLTTAAIEAGDTIFYLQNVGGLAVDDWIELYTPDLGYGYYQVRRIEGNIVTVRTAVLEPRNWPVFTQVRQVNVTEKVDVTDYTIDTWEGLVYIIPGQFTAGNNVFSDVNVLMDKKSIQIWRNFTIDTSYLGPHKFWRVYIDSTWLGDPEIAGIEFFPEQFYGSFYRGERLGYYFTLGNARPGCRGVIECNLPLLHETVQKLCNTMSEACPVCVIPVMTFIDCHYPEPINTEFEYDDRYLDEIHTRDREDFNLACELLLSPYALISTFNPTPLVPNPATQYFERGSFARSHANTGWMWVSNGSLLTPVIPTRNCEFHAEDMYKDVTTERVLMSTYNPTPTVVNPLTEFEERGSFNKLTVDGYTWISPYKHL
jgi:phage tail-like protein